MDEIEFKKYFTRLRSKGSIKSCMWGEEDSSLCSGKIVKAHSIQRSKILKKICENGKVSILSSTPNSDSMKFGFRTEGIGKFSTFSGFCQKHDKEVFQPIEDEIFKGSEEQFYIYAYRSVSKEYHGKKEILQMSEHLFNEKTGDMLNQAGIASFGQQTYLGAMELGDIAQHLQLCIANKSYSGLKHHYYCMDKEFPIACSSSFLPYFDHKGKSIISESEKKKLYEQTFPPKDTFNLYLNVFPEGGKTHFLISHFKGRKKKFDFVRKMLKGSLSNIQINMTNIILNNCENVAFSPSYIESKFTKEELNEVTRAFGGNIPDVTNPTIINVNLFRN